MIRSNTLNDDQLNEVFLTTRQVRERYGNVSAMWVHRRLTEGKTDFPIPIMIANRRFWRLSDLVAWESRNDAER